MTDIKICGLSNTESIKTAISAGASHVGFVHFSKSPRHVTLDQILRIGEAATSVIRVAVIVDPDDGLLRSLSAPGMIDVIQVHKVLSAERLAEIKSNFDFELWNAVAVENHDDLVTAQPMFAIADRTLYDAKTPKSAELPGGMGISFDWNLLNNVQHPPQWALSGGLTPENVAEAIKATGAPLVDVSSGVESQPGVKDVDKIARFCEAVQQL